MKLKDCFNERGNLKFDPYRFDSDTATPNQIAMNDLLFTDNGYLKDRAALEKFIDQHPEFKWDCHAIGLYHAEIHAYSTKDAYPTYTYFR